MSLIDNTYFILDINLPVGTYSDLNTAITKYEAEVLTQLLGYELYTLVAAYNAQTSPQRIIDIVEGKLYTVDYSGRDQIIKWNGLVNSELISLIADYVYYWYMRNQATITNNVGEIKPKQENSFNANANMKVFNAWNRARDLSGYVGQHELKPSLYNFLKENEDDYPELVFCELGRMNSHDL